MSGSEFERGELRVIANCLVTLTVIAVGATLAKLKRVLVPFVLALLVSYCLRPVVGILARKAKLPQPLGVRGAALIGLAVLLGMGLMVASLVGDVSQNLTGLQKQITAFIERYKDRFHFESFGLHFDDAGKLVSLT